MAGPQLHDDGAHGFDDGQYAGESSGEYDDGAVLYDDGGMRPSRRPLYIGLVALVIVAAAVIGFLATRDDPVPPATFSLAAAAANAGGAQRVAYDLSTRRDGNVVTTASGVLDLVTGSQQMHATAQPHVEGSEPALTPSSFVFDAAGRAVYLDASAFAAAGLHFDRPFVRIDLAHLGAGVQLDTAALLAQYGGNPLAVVPLLGRTAAQDLGAETIATEQVEHFHVVLATADLLAANPNLAGLLGLEEGAAATDPTSTSAAASTTTSAAASSAASSTSVAPTGSAITIGAATEGGATIVVDVYVTKNNVLRRLVFVPSAAATAIATVTFGQYDGDAVVAVPASDQVISLADAFGP